MIRVLIKGYLIWAWLAAQLCAAQGSDPIAELQKAIAAEPQRADLHAKLGGIFEQNKDYSRAIPELRRALELQPDLPEAQSLLGEALLAQGYSAAAIPHLERAQRLDLLGIALFEENQTQQAIEKLLAAAQAKPDDPDVLFYLGKTSGQLLQRSFDRLMRSDFGSPRAHQLMAETYLAQRQTAAAEREYREVLKTRRDLRGIHLALGKIKVAAGDLDEAEKEFRAETLLGPGDGEAAWRLGSVLLQKGRTGEALGELQRSERLRPQMIETLFDLAKAYSLENRTAEAEKAWLDVIALDDSGELAAASHFQLAQLYRRQGSIAEAERHLQRFQELQSKTSEHP